MDPECGGDVPDKGGEVAGNVMPGEQYAQILWLIGVLLYLPRSIPRLWELVLRRDKNKRWFLFLTSVMYGSRVKVVFNVE